MDSTQNIKSSKTGFIYSNNISRMFCYLLLIASPWILLSIMLYLTKGSIGDSRAVWSDELAYWHEILSCSQKGIEFGYYTINELVPSKLSFGTHGFGSISAYLPFALSAGWNNNSILLANTVYMSLAFAMLTIFARPSTKRVLFITVFYMTYTPLMLYCVTSMTELLNYALLISYFILLDTYIKSRKYKSILFVIILILTAYIACIRIIYIVLFLPILLERYKVQNMQWSLIKPIGIWLAISALLFFGSNLFISPYPMSFLSSTFEAPSIPDFIIMIIKHTLKNIYNFMNIRNGQILEILQRYFVLIAFIYLLFKSEIINSKFRKWNPTYFYALIVFSLVLVINITAYDITDWRDYRVFAPFLFSIIIFLTLSTKNNKTIQWALSINLTILAIAFISQAFTSTIQGFAVGRYNKVETIEELKHLKYTTDAKSKFENTILVTEFNPDIALNIPAGIGISYLTEKLSDDFEIKSRYIYSKQRYSLKTHHIISESKQGYLYVRNQ